MNISGGTEIGACLLSPLPILPLKPCTLGGPALGIDLDVFNEQGQSIKGSGRVGELVVKKPWPAMTRGIWMDPQRYLETYWSRWPNVWVHGDWASVDEDGFWYLHGRSDDTLKIAGKRIGPAEIESALVSHPAVSEAAAIGIPHPLKGEVAACFVILKPGYEPTESLREEVKHHAVKQLGKALGPETIKFVKDLPRTRNAKIMRRLIRAKYLGSKELGDLSALENPTALEAISQAL
jgi:acetyl-CoA synthetase